MNEKLAKHWLYLGLQVLNRRERGIVLMRIEGKTLDEVGKEYGITRERVRQIEKRSEERILLMGKIVLGNFPRESYEKYTPIEVLNLSPRTQTALINSDIGSIQALLQCSKKDLEGFRGLGWKGIEEIEYGLNERNLKLRPNKPIFS